MMMRQVFALGLLTSLMLVSASCSKSAGQKSQTLISLAGFIGASELLGGVVIKGTSTSGASFTIALANGDELQTVSLKSESWQFSAVGWLGPGPLEGTTKCGTATKVLAAENEAVALTLSAANCANEEFSIASHLSGNDFLPLQLIACNSISGATASTNCDSTKGDIRSYRLILPEIAEDGIATDGLTSACFDDLNTPANTPTSYRLPVGSPATVNKLGFALAGYSNTACTGTVHKFDFSDGLLFASGSAALFADVSSTLLYLEASFSPPVFSYSSSAIVLNQNTAMTSMFPSSTGGAITSYSISPPLPSGLLFNSSTGELYGGPGAIQALQTYIVTASGPGGDEFFSIDITILDQVPVFTSYTSASASYVQGAVIINNVPTLSGGAPSSFNIAPALPPGLIFNNATGEISGTPSGAQSSTNYTVTASNSGGSDNITISITILTPALLSIDQSDPFDYGTVGVGSSQTQFFTITNNGQSIATAMSGTGLAAPYSFAGGAFPGSGGNCTTALASGSSCTVVVAFDPASQGIQVETFDVSYHDGASAQIASKSLTGNAINPAVLSITDGPTYDFGTVTTGASAEKLFTITNSGGVSATALNEIGLAAPFVFTGGGYPGLSGTCGASLASAATCQIEISYQPVSTGVHNGGINLSYFDGLILQSASRAITGTGTTPAVLTITDAPMFKFNIVPTNQVVNKTFTISNSGGSTAMALNAFALTSGFSYQGGVYPGTGGTCTATLAPAANCTVTVQFVNSLAGESLETLSIGYDDGATAQMLSLEIIALAGDPQDVVVGTGNTCVLFSSGHVKCWGNNASGQLGLGDVSVRGSSPGTMGPNLPIVNLGAGFTVMKVALGSAHACALSDLGDVKCWGDNSAGQLGLGVSGNRGDAPGEMGDLLPIVDLGIGRFAVDIALGAQFSCAVLDDNSVKCWGTNTTGQLGQGDTTSRGLSAAQLSDNLLPINLGTGRTALFIHAGSNHACAVLDTFNTKCWGLNSFGALGKDSTLTLGDGPSEMGDSLTEVNLGNTVDLMGLGSDFSCAILFDGSLKCWGKGSNGQLGHGATTSIGASAGSMSGLTAINLGTGRTATAITAGAMSACALLDNFSVKCWGANTFGQLATGNTLALGDATSEMGDFLAPLDFNGANVQILSSPATGANHFCAILTDNSVKCWGNNSSGQLGIENINNIGDGPSEMGAALQGAMIY